MDDGQLRDSLRLIGPILPTIKVNGRVLDGRRRERLSPEVGRKTRVIELSPQDALRALWLLHPERAIEEAGKLTLEEYAQAFGVRVLDVAKALNAKRRQAPAIDPRQLGRASTLVQVWCPPRLHYVTSLAARERGQNLSEFVREAVATHAARFFEVDAYELARADLKQSKSHTHKPRSVAGVEHRSSRRR